jgi:hypothetical protein
MSDPIVPPNRRPAHEARSAAGWRDTDLEAALASAEFCGEMIEFGLDGGHTLQLHIERPLHVAADPFQRSETMS